MDIEKSSPLFTMLAELASRPELLEQFKDATQRSTMMSKYGLSDEQIRLLEEAIDTSKHDLERYSHIAKLVGDEASLRLIPFC